MSQKSLPAQRTSVQEDPKLFAKPPKKQPSEINNLFTALKTEFTLDERRAIER